MKKIILSVCSFLNILALEAQQIPEQVLGSKFEQLDQLLPTPNNFRTADGSPGHEYWQQKADYKINVSLDDDKQWIKGSEIITYYNQSPNELLYLWLQLDQNLFHKESNTYKTQAFDLEGNNTRSLMGWVTGQNSSHGYKIGNVKDAKGKSLTYTENATMMRIDLPEPLKKGQKFTFSLDWEFYVIDANKMGGRGGYEYFPEDKNYLYEMAQWFPRMAVYNDVRGWQHKQFLGQGEFALVFGDYEVNIDVPADHIVAATGELQNANQVLTKTQIQRLEDAKKAKEPLMIVNPKEAEQNEKSRAKNRKTWIFKAANVRDFAWASSRKFIWDAFQVQNGTKKVWAMSFYPKEGNPLWQEKSTWTVAHTLDIYSKYTFEYPYPVAISVHGPIFGMEY
ncbi:MAG: M1 family peptidase, partial [Thermonemataceae bacterium]|nr:M1 family peptidase [Thermonemataceae bacterium]